MVSDRVLVTGATGFVAKNCIAACLKAGFAVRGTVRDRSRADEIEKALRRAGVDHSPIELVEADLLRDENWDQALDGCRYVLHVASPFPLNEPRSPNELIRPARDGAERVMRAAARAGAERLVQTSSVAAVMHSSRPNEEPRTETDWTNLNDPEVATYARSKTLAERAIWKLHEELKSEGTTMEVATINPGVVLGPALDRDLSTSHALVRMIARGVYPALPKVAFPVADVRDVAHHHVLALTHPAAPGNRWLSCDGSLSLREMGQIIVETLPDLKRKVPTIELPSGLVRLFSHFDRNLKSIRVDLGRANRCDTSKSEQQLGMSFRSAKEAVRAAALSLRELKVI